jgi:hypothetical protein
MSTLGTNGRFANQIFQYFFLKLIEKNLGHEIRYPMWLGAHIFHVPPSPNGIPDVGSSIFQKYYEPDASPDMELVYLDQLLRSESRPAIDLIGFFQYHTKFLKSYKNLFLEAFEIQENLIHEVFTLFANKGLDFSSMVGVHVRRGDFLLQKGSPIFWCHSTKSIFSALNEYELVNAKGKFIYLATDDPVAVSKEFSDEKINFVTSFDLGIDLNEAQRTLVDFLCLTLSGGLLISNSSFSFAASMMNANSKLFLRPNPNSADGFIQFDPWNSPILLSRIG